MKTVMHDSMNLKKSQYSSRIIVSPNTTSNKNGPKLTYSRRGVSVDPHREGMKLDNNFDNDVININSLITQTTKGANRPNTGGNLINFAQNKSQDNAVNSPRPNSERVAYSVSPNRAAAKSMIKHLPPKQRANINKKTLVLDLDETLVHSGFKPFGTNSDIILKIELENKIHDIHVLVRPGVEEFLDRMSKHYELVVFTASLSKYADPLVDKLDPKRLCFYRLFRQHCTEINRAFVKDLRKLDRDLKDVIILDNSPISYALNVENGFPIKNWYDDRSDRELYNISPVLEFLAYVPDVRDFIKRMVEKNEISYPKAVNLMNNFQLSNNENLNSLNLNNKTLSTKSQNTNQNINTKLKDFIYKPNQDLNPYANLNENKHEEKENSRYGSNLTSNRQREGCSYMDESNVRRELDNKQNINIKIINNHINQYIIDPQESLVPDRSNMNMDFTKKHKNINTFRNSYNNPSQIQNNNNADNTNLNKSNNQNQLNNNIDNLKQNPNYLNNYNRFNLKNLNLNVGVEVKSPVLKNTKMSPPISNPQNQPKNQVNSINSSNKYSSLIDTRQSSQSVSRPSSAIIIKAAHSRDVSTHSLKNEQLNLNMNQHGSPLARTPSSQSIINELNRNYSKHNLNLRRETPKHNYLTNFEIPKNLNYSQGIKTLRPSSTHEKLRINYSTNSNSLNNINNLNPIKSANRYEPEDFINKRGYSLSSRAVDLRQQVYKLKDNEVKYQLQSNNNKFSASALYRSNIGKK